MNTTQREEIIQSLVDFVKRASCIGATADEIAALPAVSDILLSRA